MRIFFESKSGAGRKFTPRKAPLDCNVRSFQYKVLNNVPYLNKKLLIFGKLPSSLCSFCKQVDETILQGGEGRGDLCFGFLLIVNMIFFFFFLFIYLFLFYFNFIFIVLLIFFWSLYFAFIIILLLLLLICKFILV